VVARAEAKAQAKAKAKAKAFTALRAASYFLLLVQENVTKEKDTPSRTARMKPARCPRAGANSAIHGLKHGRLSPEPGSAARCETNGDLRAKNKSNRSKAKSNPSLKFRAEWNATPGWLRPEAEFPNAGGVGFSAISFPAA
jgi:hypothetical protein